MIENRFLPRVWDEEYKTHYYPEFSDRTGKLSFWNKYGDRLPLKDVFRKDSNYVLEACTGIKDKNGKLIYEGDIIEDMDSEIKSRYVIKYNAEKGFWMAGTYALAMCVEALRERYSVIGNID